MVGKTKHQIKADEARMSAIVEICCIACAIEGRPGVPCQVHHMLNGYRLGHQYSIGLCPWHHEGDTPAGCNGSVELATKRYGPSLERNSRAFHARYGDDDELLIIQDAAIRISERAKQRGEYMPDFEMCDLVRMLWREVVMGKSPSKDSVQHYSGVK